MQEEASQPATRGRPTKYDPAFCDKVIELGREGKSRAYIAGKLGISRETLNVWAREIPDFSDAMTQAMLLSQIWWEDKGQENLTESIFQASMWSRSMAARFPDDWREVSRQEQSGPDKSPMQVNVTGDAIADLTSRLARLAAAGRTGGDAGQPE